MKKPILPIALAGGVILSSSVPSHMALAVNPVAIAKKYMGTPYQWGQNDCSGFTKKVFGQLGIDLPHNSALQAAFGKPVDKGDLKSGDLVFFNTSGSGISHVGIYVGGGWMISSESEATGVRETQIFGGGSASYWEQRFVTGRRLETNSSESKKLYVQAAPSELSTIKVEGRTRHASGSICKSRVQTMHTEDFMKNKSRYTVRMGDTLSAISVRVRTSVSALKLLNGLSTDVILPGQILRLTHPSALKKDTLTSLLSRKAWFLNSITDQNVTGDQSDNQLVKNTPSRLSLTNRNKNTLWTILNDQGITVLKFQKLVFQKPIPLVPGQKVYLR